MTDHPLQRLLAIMASLRDPKTGCPWDVEQDFASIAPCAVEEAYEVGDAIARGDMAALKEELGDLLLQVVFHAQMAKEKGLFDFDAVAGAIADKLVERHPHVFGEAKVTSAAEQTEAWERIKDAKRRASAEDAPESALDGVTAGLPPLLRALKLQKRAARVGFDWPDAHGALAKLEEEVAELREALAENPSSAHNPLPDPIAEELGDALFSLVNVARKTGLDADAALQAANRKFESRFRAMEAAARSNGMNFNNLSLEEMERLWQAVKTQRR